MSKYPMISLLFVAALNLICAAYNRFNGDVLQSMYYMLLVIIAIQIVLMLKLFKG